MFIGHFAAAFAIRAASRDTPKLGALFFGAQLVDWAFFIFAIIGLEQVRIVPGITAMNPLDLYHLPYTHSLLGSAVFALLFAAGVFLALRSMIAAFWGAMVVMSHWLLDFLVHRPDLTIGGAGEKYGLGLWNYPMVEMPLEIGITLLAFWWFLRRTKGPIIPPFVLIAAMLAFQAVNWFGPPPTSAGIFLYISALFAFAVLTALAWWVGQTRWHRGEVGLAVASSRR